MNNLAKLRQLHTEWKDASKRCQDELRACVAAGPDASRVSLTSYKQLMAEAQENFERCLFPHAENLLEIAEAAEENGLTQFSIVGNRKRLTVALIKLNEVTP